MRKNLSMMPWMLAAICFIAYFAIGSEVDDGGLLIEPFWLLVLGWLFFAFGIVTTVILAILKAKKQRPKTKNEGKS